VAGTISTKILVFLALGNLEFEKRTLDFTESTLELEDQSSSSVPLPHLAGVLQASPPRNRG
jgi:hypothetical protein